jgi:hypothetical protein
MDGSILRIRGWPQAVLEHLMKCIGVGHICNSVLGQLKALISLLLKWRGCISFVERFLVQGYWFRLRNFRQRQFGRPNASNRRLSGAVSG